MKKTLLSVVAMLATGGAVMAQNGVTEVPDAEGHMYMCTVLSPNGRYLGGSNGDNTGGFIYDTQSKKVVGFASPDADTDLQLKSINDEGVAGMDTIVASAVVLLGAGFGVLGSTVNPFAER